MARNTKQAQPTSTMQAQRDPRRTQSSNTVKPRLHPHPEIRPLIDSGWERIQFICDTFAPQRAVNPDHNNAVGEAAAGSAPRLPDPGCQYQEEKELEKWMLVRDDAAALTLMKKYLPGHRPSPQQLKNVGWRKAIFAPLSVLGVPRARAMSEIMEALESGVGLLLRWPSG